MGLPGVVWGGGIESLQSAGPEIGGRPSCERARTSLQVLCEDNKKLRISSYSTSESFFFFFNPGQLMEIVD